MEISKKKALFVSAICGLLLALSFPPMPLNLVAFVAFIPLLYIFTELEYKGNKYLLIYVAFFCYHFGTNWWIMSWQKETDPYLMAAGFFLALAHPFFFFIPFWCFFFIKKHFGKIKALFLFPVFWTSFEWLHSLGEFSYPWLTVGNTQITNLYWIQFIDISGIWGSSFLILLGNVLFFQILMKFKSADGNKINLSILMQTSGTKRNFILLLAMFIIPLIYGYISIKKYDFEKLLFGNQTINIGLIQPNINPWLKWEDGVIDQIKVHIEMQDSLKNSLGQLDLGIWSETAIPYYSLDLNALYKYEFIQKWVDTSKTALLTGFSQLELYTARNEAPITARYLGGEDGPLYEPYNAMLLLNPYPHHKTNPQFYQKMRLTPFAERLPYAEYLLFARSWFEWGVGISAWGRGLHQNNLIVKKGDDAVEIGTIICIESIYPGFVKNFTEQGAQILIVVTNDAWYDHTIGPRQHYLLSVARAIENRRFIARCANTGVTGFIAPTGISEYEAPQYEKTAIAMSVPILENKSIYVKFGDWLPMFTTLISVFFIGFATFRKFSR